MGLGLTLWLVAHVIATDHRPPDAGWSRGATEPDLRDPFSTPSVQRSARPSPKRLPDLRDPFVPSTPGAPPLWPVGARAYATGDELKDPFVTREVPLQRPRHSPASGIGPDRHSGAAPRGLGRVWDDLHDPFRTLGSGPIHAPPGA